MPLDPCKGKVSAASKNTMSEQEAGVLLDRLRRLATQRAEEKGQDFNEALREVAGEMQKSQSLAAEIQKRNMLLDIRARREAKSFIRQFPTLGEGLLALLEGSSKVIPGARNSVDYQAKALHGKYIGALIAGLEKDDLLSTFRNGKLSREIYIEMGELTDSGTPGKTGSIEAQKIASIIHNVTEDMVSRQNRAGAAINKVPGYIVRQTHDMDEIRRAGGMGTSKENQAKSLAEWVNFTLPLLDPDKTFQGANSTLWMRNVHEALYTGVHGPDSLEADVHTLPFHQDISKKASSSRVLHFKNAEAAFEYNQRFGIRDLKDQVFSDIFYRSKNITLMERLGPSAGQNWEKLLREVNEEARAHPDSITQLNSLSNWKIQTAFDTVTGKSDIPVNYGLSRAMNIVRSVQVLSKMGSTLISALSDTVFLNQESAYQGISRLDTWGQQFTGLFKRTDERKSFLRLAGVAMDGIIGNTISRYTAHTGIAGTFHKLQQKLFDVNFLNWWTDTNKATMAELMSAHLGEHSTLTFEEIPDELRRVLSLYNITRSQWDAIRSTTWVPEGHDISRISPDKVKELTTAQLLPILEEQGLKNTETNLQRVRDQLEINLRTYFADRVDFAVPTPGAAEKRWTTFGTRPGTPLGEAVRMVMMFKAFPISILSKIMDREIHGAGNNTIGDWLKNNHKGKFNTAQLIAMTIAAGYLSGVIRDALKGRTPKPFFVNGEFQPKTLVDAAARGGGLGIMGDFLFNEYDAGHRSALAQLAGPVVSQFDPLAETATLMKRGEYVKALDKSGKLLKDNLPFANLFYLRPILDYFIFWNLQEITNPGSLRRMEDHVVKQNKQGFFMRPSETVK